MHGSSIGLKCEANTAEALKTCSNERDFDVVGVVGVVVVAAAAALLYIDSTPVHCEISTVPALAFCVRGKQLKH